MAAMAAESRSTWETPNAEEIRSAHQFKNFISHIDYSVSTIFTAGCQSINAIIGIPHVETGRCPFCWSWACSKSLPNTKLSSEIPPSCPGSKSQNMFVVGDMIIYDLPAPSKGWCLNPKGLLSGTPYPPIHGRHPLQGRVQVWMFFFQSQEPSIVSLSVL